MVIYLQVWEQVGERCPIAESGKWRIIAFEVGGQRNDASGRWDEYRIPVTDVRADTTGFHRSE